MQKNAPKIGTCSDIMFIKLSFTRCDRFQDGAYLCPVCLFVFFCSAGHLYRALHTLATRVGILRNLRFPQKKQSGKSRWHISWGIVIVVAKRDCVCGLVSQDLVIGAFPDASYSVVIVLCPRVLVSRSRLESSWVQLWVGLKFLSSYWGKVTI